MYRLPGPMTMRSASAMAARASSEARTSSGVIQTRSMPAVRMIRDWPSTIVPSVQRAWSVERRRRHRDDLAAHGEDPVEPADALLEVAALDGRHGRQQQVAEGMAAESARVPPAAAASPSPAP